jgi:hypothetical protein
MLSQTAIHRRCFLLGLLLARHLRGSVSDFWNQKPEFEWTPEEVQQLLTSSPWAKRVRATISVLRQERERAAASSDVTPAAQRCSEKSGPVELNRGDRSTCASGQTVRVPSSEVVNYHFTGTVRWESALPVGQASKSSLSNGFVDHYLLSVHGLPVGNGVSTKGELKASNAAIESIRRASSLTVENWMRRRPAVPAQAARIEGDALLLFFPRQSLHLAAADNEVEFRTVIKAANVAAKFKLRPMIFRGELAL